MSSTVLLATKMLSINPLPDIKVDCDPSIILGKTFFTLLDKILDITLYMHPTREIGLYPSNVIGFSVSNFGSCIYMIHN